MRCSLLSAVWVAIAASSGVLGLPLEETVPGIARGQEDGTAEPLQKRQNVLQGPLLNGAIPGLPDLSPILSNNTFDYVVVGAGTAGLTMANRLSQSGRYTVAVIEGGTFYQVGPGTLSI